MPLKPIFMKAPLKSLERLPLYPGQCRVKNESAEALLQLGLAENTAASPALWEGLYRVAMLTGSDRAGEVEELIRTAAIDGRPAQEQLQVMRAVLAVYERTADRALLETLVKQCGELSARWDEVMACAEIRRRPADLMELLQTLYRVTGKKGLINLMDRLRRESMDWSGVLHTFAVQRDMAHVTPWKDMEAGLAAEGGSEEGFYTRQSVICHGESLADGARAALLSGIYSGNGQELSAARKGWERVSRFHGAVCGGISSDEMVAGMSPAAGIDAAATGAWLEALVSAAASDQDGWAWDAAARILTNAVPRHTMDGLNDLIRVNSLKACGGDQGAYHLHEGSERRVRALSRLLRGTAAILENAVCTTADGAAVNLPVDGTFTVLVSGSPLTLKVEGKKITVSVRKETAAVLKIRMPGWAKDAELCVNGTWQLATAGGWTALERTWQNGDTIEMSMTAPVETRSGHHQGVYVTKGDALYVLPSTGDNWSRAACGEAYEEDGRILLDTAVTEGWRVRGAVPADLPVLPAVKGAAEKTELKPFAQYCGIALLPKGNRA